MKRVKLLAIGLILTLFGHFLDAQMPFKRGVNLTNWFQTANPKQIQFSKYTKQDFQNIKNLGCDVVRLPINLHHMAGAKPDYTIDPLLFDFLDQVVTWAEDLKIYLLLDNHSTDEISSQNPDLENLLAKVWEQMAVHYKNRSHYILYEILNEPNGITTQAWGKIQQTAINIIRQTDLVHTIVVGPANWNSYTDLSQLPVYTDNNLIYTFHFYDPFLFTHQGATWPNPSMESLSKIPFPYNADSMPAFPNTLKGTWLENAYNNYKNDGTVSKIKQLIDIAAAFKTNRKVNVYCGEYGVYIPNSKDSDRAYWYGEVRKYLEEKGIPWTTWDYQAGFGLFKKGSNELFDYDLNIPLLKALGLNIPDQKRFTMKPDSVGFSVYSDFIGERILESSYANGGNIDYYDTDKPNNGKYCLLWTGCARYGAIGFNFVPDKDLFALSENNYALSLLVKGNTPGTKFDIRFMDSKTSVPNDHPWRMSYTLDESIARWDGKWNKIYIPLKNFKETGAWDNAWFNPIGAFDWKAVDRLEIAAEQSDLIGKSFWFDNITITNKDTAHLYELINTGLNESLRNDNYKVLRVHPNPVNNLATISYDLTGNGQVDISIFKLSGEKIRTIVSSRQRSGTYSISWNVDNDRKNKVSSGIYICRMLEKDNMYTSKITVINN